MIQWLSLQLISLEIETHYPSIHTRASFLFCNVAGGQQRLKISKQRWSNDWKSLKRCVARKDRRVFSDLQAQKKNVISVDRYIEQRCPSRHTAVKGKQAP